MSGKRVLAFLIARPLIAVAIAAVVVGVLLLLQTHKQTTPVTHRTQHVELSDEQQTQLGNQQYAKTLREDQANIVSSGADYRQVQRVATRIETVAGRDKPAFDWKVTLLRKNEANAYQPREAVAFWQRMQRASRGKEPPEFASDHPSDEHRIQRIEDWLPEAEPAYRPGPPD